MYKILCTLLILSISQIQAQTYFAKDSLDVNDLNVLIYSNGAMPQDLSSNMPGQKLTRGHERSICYASDLWVSGVNASSGEYSLWSSSYSSNPSYDGPVATDYYSDNYWKYKRTWKLTKDQIQYHKDNVGKSGYSMLEEIESWPAHGDLSNGESYYLAPFVDWNQDGKYTPQWGDYPCIKGDMAIYTIANDEANLQNKYQKFPLEVHLLAYGFESASPALDKTIFLEYKIINRSTSSYTDLKVGFWQDFDVGCTDDDYIGCDTNLNVFYAYNGDTYDEDCRGVMGHDSILPFVGTTFLNQKMTSFMLYDQYIQSAPNSEAQFSLFMSSIWSDGTHLVYGGNGHQSDPNATNKTTNYFYPSDPRDTSSSAWNEISRDKADTSGNPPFDRRGVGSIGPFTLLHGEVLELSMATVVSYDSSKRGNEYLDVFDNFKNDVAFVRDYYQNNINYCPNWATGIDTPMAEVEVVMYPNPATEEVNLELNGLRKAAEMEVYDVMGKLMLKTKLEKGQKNTLDVSKWNRGLYLLHMKLENEVLIEKLLVN